MISKSQINKIGDILRTYPSESVEYRNALLSLERYRKAHIYPLKTFKSNLDKRLVKYEGSLSAQRLKRMPTILDKVITRERSMRLSAMQDIGGIRAIMKSVAQVEKLVKDYENSKRFTHILRHGQTRDYVTKPKENGYRGVHLVYEYNNTLARSTSAQESKGMLIEIQIRSELQHIWATAVETVDAITGQSLKNNQGDRQWREFFKLASSVFAIIEDRNVIQEYHDREKREIYQRLVELINEMDVFAVLGGYSAGLQIIDEVGKSHYYHLLVLDVKNRKMNITGFSEDDYALAVKEYESIESEGQKGVDAVLVSAGRRQKLKKAYPNYYLDLERFKGILSTILVEFNHSK